MNKVLEFGRKAMFYVRVLSGYEERRIRSYRLQLQKRLQHAEERKAAVRKIPEQIILTEVRRMVEDMQAMNRKLEETVDNSVGGTLMWPDSVACLGEAAINEYFKPLDKEAEIIMKTQLDGEEKSMKEMMKAMQSQALLEKAEADRIATLKNTEADGIETVKIAEANQHIEVKPSASTKQAEVRS
ncbi:hypothetical protein RHSIM_Rhsim07G0118700 [Rhododendron simsii]|uniref:Uncharacterized protein n=1 Tax=Rhododendron simsii TaxID=118357 RepID=A0A834LFY8_RHOSS|nr:hypothetical protein RHSIM_Rhsim07G0118700 [Rhododendron simsii]